MKVFLSSLLCLLCLTANAQSDCAEKSEGKSFVGCGTVHYFADIPGSSEMITVERESKWTIWRDSEDWFIVYFDQKLPEVTQLARNLGHPARCWQVPKDDPKLMPLFNSGRAWRPVGTVVLISKKEWEKSCEGGVLKEYFAKVLHDITPQGRTRCSGGIVPEPELVVAVGNNY